MTTGDDFKGMASKALYGRLSGHAVNGLVVGLVMGASFLGGFLPFYTSFLDRLGRYDERIGIMDQRLSRAEKDIVDDRADVRAGNQATSSRLDTLIKSMQDTRELILSKQGAK